MALSKTAYAIHTLSEEMKLELREETHHYCDIFTKKLFFPLPKTVYVEKTGYEVNKNKRIVLVSYDGKLNLWQCAPTFFSNKPYNVETCITDSEANIVSIITAKNNNLYAISCFDGFSGKFETKRDWLIQNGDKGIIYGNRTFSSREDLWEYLEGRTLGPNMDLQAIVVKAAIPRIILFDLISGLEVSHNYIRGDFDVVVVENYL